MTPDRVIVEAIKVAQDLLRQNLPPMPNLTDAATVLRLRELVRSPSIRSALDRSSDTRAHQRRPAGVCIWVSRDWDGMECNLRSLPRAISSGRSVQVDLRSVEVHGQDLAP